MFNNRILVVHLKNGQIYRIETTSKVAYDTIEAFFSSDKPSFQVEDITLYRSEIASLSSEVTRENI